jgi:hypothetical protein
MQKGPATLFLELLQQLINLILHVLCVLDLEEEQSPEVLVCSSPTPAQS